MNKNSSTSHGYTPTLEIKNTERNRDFWLELPRLDETTRQSLRAADILIVPEGDDYQGKGAYFPEGTTEFYHFLIAQNAAVEVTTNEEDFQELARHFDLYILGDFVLNKLSVPIFVALLVKYLDKRVLNSEKSAVKFALTCQHPDGSAKRLEYEGPVSTFETQIQPLLPELIGESLSDSQPPALPPAPDGEAERSEDDAE